MHKGKTKMLKDGSRKRGSVFVLLLYIMYNIHDIQQYTMCKKLYPS